MSDPISHTLDLEQHQFRGTQRGRKRSRYAFSPLPAALGVSATSPSRTAIQTLCINKLYTSGSTSINSGVMSALVQALVDFPSLPSQHSVRLRQYQIIPRFNRSSGTSLPVSDV